MDVCRYMFGEGMEKMSFEQLNVFEKQLELWIYEIRSAKVSKVKLFAFK